MTVTDPERRPPTQPDHHPALGFLCLRHQVIFVTLTDGGHIWPNLADNVGFDANLAVIEFFNRH